MIRWVFFCLLALMGCAQTQDSKRMINSEVKALATPNYEWLEEVEGVKPIEWVKEKNKLSLEYFTKDPRYDVFFDEAKNILNAQDRIPFGSIRGQYVYNFWQDENHIRGLWRRATLNEYKKQAPSWETLIDIDELARKETKNWVFKGSQCLAPEYRLCMVRLSDGGKDASSYREYDTVEKSFVANGFNLPEAKSNIEWVDEETLLVATDFGKGSLTNSGYPRIIKAWRRGQELSLAETVIEAPADYVSVWAQKTYGSSGDHLFLTKSQTFTEDEIYYVDLEKGWNLLLLPIQKDAIFHGVFQGRIILELRSDWLVNNKKFVRGSLVDFSLDEFIKSGRRPVINQLYNHKSSVAVSSVAVSKNAVYVSVLDNVKAKLLRFQFKKGLWKSNNVKMPKSGSINLISFSPDSSQVMFSYENFITPQRLYLSDDTNLRPKVVKRNPDRFNAKGLVVKQKFVKSSDGTKIPYFIIAKKRLSKYGENKTLLYGYGGFEISMTPFYSATLGKLWLERGGTYVLANIRGGGEYGPAWHQAAVKENRQRSYDDFIAVAQDLIKQNITASNYLGIKGGSNGGLLVGVAMTQYPELFNAVISSVPLLDMLRYHKLLAGASWMSEYGNPEDPGMHTVLKSYSPFHNVKKNKNYPEAFFMTSTKDDRVHPGHARKMVAKMTDMGHNVYYYENMEGGHSASANRIQAAKNLALEYVYLHQKLTPKVD